MFGGFEMMTGICVADGSFSCLHRSNSYRIGPGSTLSLILLGFSPRCPNTSNRKSQDSRCTLCLQQSLATMKRKFLADNEKERLEVLRRYQILDTDSEKDFEDIVELASQLCDSPMAVINFIDEDRQWAKAFKGIDIRETDREVSFCTHAIESTDVMIV